MRDAIDDYVERWQHELPELDPTVEAVVGRMHVLTRYLGGARRRALAGRELQLWEYKTLLDLRRRGAPYRATPKELAAALGLSPAAVTKRLTALERAGYVTRSHDTEDRRRVHVTLTPLGKRVWEQTQRAEGDVERALLSALDADELEQLAALLRRLVLAARA